jgi:hypothetical protein
MFTGYAGPDWQISKSASISKAGELGNSWLGGAKHHISHGVKPTFQATRVLDLTTHCTKSHDFWWYGVLVIYMIAKEMK